LATVPHPSVVPLSLTAARLTTNSPRALSELRSLIERQIGRESLRGTVSTSEPQKPRAELRTDNRKQLVFNEQLVSTWFGVGNLESILKGHAERSAVVVETGNAGIIELVNKINRELSVEAQITIQKPNSLSENKKPKQLSTQPLAQNSIHKVSLKYPKAVDNISFRFESLEEYGKKMEEFNQAVDGVIDRWQNRAAQLKPISDDESDFKQDVIDNVFRKFFHYPILALDFYMLAVEERQAENNGGQSYLLALNDLRDVEGRAYEVARIRGIGEQFQILVKTTRENIQEIATAHETARTAFINIYLTKLRLRNIEPDDLKVFGQ